MSKYIKIKTELLLIIKENRNVLGKDLCRNSRDSRYYFISLSYFMHIDEVEFYFLHSMIEHDQMMDDFDTSATSVLNDFLFHHELVDNHTYHIGIYKEKKDTNVFL